MIVASSSRVASAVGGISPLPPPSRRGEVTVGGNGFGTLTLITLSVLSGRPLLLPPAVSSLCSGTVFCSPLAAGIGEATSAEPGDEETTAVEGGEEEEAGARSAQEFGWFSGNQGGRGREVVDARTPDL